MQIIDKLQKRNQKIKSINEKFNKEIENAYKDFFKNKEIDKVIFENKPIFYLNDNEFLYILNVRIDCFGYIIIRNMFYNMPSTCCDTDINDINLNNRQKIEILERMYNETN